MRWCIKKNSFLLVLAVWLFAGCQKVIHIDINSVDKKYVIEGTVTDNEDSYNVIISQTLDITDSNIFKGIDNALVTIDEDGKTPVVLVNKGNGLYRANATGRPGHTYHLTVKIGDQVFSASSVMPQKAAFDSLYVTERPFLGRVQKIATVAFTDPPVQGNAYRFTQYVDGRKENTIFITDDKLFNGKTVDYELLIFSDDEDDDLDTYDDLRVEMRCIDTENYNYWYSLTQGALGQNQSASPGNPVSNIKGGALGYFSANTFEVKNITVP
ncbi:hypothetical protein A8C56_04120 [Niabella ginsenosidivorans]|uniref:DUF4249 domain-containing protein n=1 Tax=Niabella ginsenosidivorans TaxID=1176587 RepID=A0A1A9HY13_9BACT|nr:DUF4249 domain-containing protein [Niabella ginsenosidivorans]ANH80277.1 hypothetical protein A8C56_04120 [Niabella ginsenosidivorans]